MEKIIIKKLEESFFKGSQSVEFKGLYRFNDYKVKITIDKDSYDNQSSARVYVWNNLKWSLIDSIHYSEMNVVKESVSPYSDIDNAFIRLKFRVDINTLKAKAKQILF